MASVMCIDWDIVFHIGDTLLLFFVLLFQSGLLNYYILQYSNGEISPYFWFLGDFITFCIFAIAMYWSFKYLKRQKRKKRLAQKLEELKNIATNGNGHLSDSASLHSVTESMYNEPLNFKEARELEVLRNKKTASLSSLSSVKSWKGSLPMVYASWFLYSVIMIAKVAIIFKAEIPNIIQPTDVFGPQLLKVAIASSSVMFILLVAGHHDADRDSPRSQYILNLCKSVSFEILDSVDFLTILILSLSRITLPFWFENVVLSFACMNFILPTIALYKLSLSDFGQGEQNLPLDSLYKLLHLCLVNIPYLCIRIYLWDGYGNDISMFTIKNAIGILLGLRSIWTDLAILWNAVLRVIPHGNKIGDKRPNPMEMRHIR